MKDRKEHDGDVRPSAAFPFESRYVTVDGHRIHYIEEGWGDPILFIHGNPTWSYIWRNVLPVVARQSGRRGIAMDLLGFGRSDKPDVAYTAALHARIVEGFIKQLGLRNVVLVLQDWGGPLGTHYAVRHPGNVQGIALMETFLWHMLWDDFGKYRTGFKVVRSAAGYALIQVMNLFVNKLLPGAVLRKEHMTAEIMRRYREPFPTVASRRAIRMFPQLLPIECVPRESADFIEDIQQRLSSLTMPVLWIKANPGLIVTENTLYHLLLLRDRVRRLDVKDFGPGLHYLQEDNPGRLARLLLGWLDENRLGKGVVAPRPVDRRAA